MVEFTVHPMKGLIFHMSSLCGFHVLYLKLSSNALRSLILFIGGGGVGEDGYGGAYRRNKTE